MVRCTNQTHEAFFVVERCAPGGAARGVATEARSPDPSRSFTKLKNPWGHLSLTEIELALRAPLRAKGHQTHKASYVVERCAPGGTARGVAAEARTPDPSRPFTKLKNP